MSAQPTVAATRQWVGRPYPLGATYDGSGTNFSLFTSVAEGVELCLLDPDGGEVRIALTEVDGHCWHTYLPDLRPGQRYGYRVHGPWDPDRGLWCNPAKLLLDPYAKTIDGSIDWDPACFGYDFDDPDQPNTADSAPHVSRGVVHDPFFDWGNDRPPAVAMHETIIYEAHVKGLTFRHPAVPEELRGTYAGMAHPAVIEHLTDLGITAIELMPVHQFIHDHHLVERGLRNYWGYNSVAFLAPHNDYSFSHRQPGLIQGQVQEFKTMVKALHNAGIEVILDVVYNHTAEGNHMGPMLSMRGIDNLAYYRVVDGTPRHYLDFTGTGNSLNMRHPHVLQLIMDSLRYWVTEMHVDGFRFDLASTLARELYAVDRLSAFFDLVQQDPVVSQVKLIAEPWDVGEGGYQVGNFPPLWSEWNGQYRDTIRDFWRGEPADAGRVRLSVHRQLRPVPGRLPTPDRLDQLRHRPRRVPAQRPRHVQREGQRGQRRRQPGRRVAQPVVELWDRRTDRRPRDPSPSGRQRRNLFATLLLSQGVPMILGGDELGRTQGGNNNAYCQDNEISWLDWESVDTDLLAFCQKLTKLRSRHPVFRRRRWFQGRAIRGTEDLAWLRPDGQPMSDDDWDQGFARAVGVFLNGAAIPTPDVYGGRIVDDSFLILFNASELDLTWSLPGEGRAAAWTVVCDTAEVLADGTVLAAAGVSTVPQRSVLVLQADPVPAT